MIAEDNLNFFTGYFNIGTLSVDIGHIPIYKFIGAEY